MRDHGSTPALPTPETASSGEQPLARFLYLAINKHPNRNLSSRDREFLKMVLSKQGQEVVNRDGFNPLPESVAKEWRTKFGIEK